MLLQPALIGNIGKPFPRTVSIPQAVSTITSSPLFSLPFGQGLEMCGPYRRFAPLLPRTLRRIPQAVGTVTSTPLFSLPFSQGLEMCGPHRRFTPLLPRTLRRIPQAVGTVATHCRCGRILWVCSGFNTASGKHCCNINVDTFNSTDFMRRFNTASGRHCCNMVYCVRIV